MRWASFLNCSGSEGLCTGSQRQSLDELNSSIVRSVELLSLIELNLNSKQSLRRNGPCCNSI
jgi:hypothetical protein